MRRIFLLPLVVSVVIFHTISTGWAVVSENEFLDFDLSQLMQVKVISVTKKPQELADSAAAVFVISQEDIRRSGVTSIPEALRMAPGLQVARISSNKWAITSRGFNGFFANKLLVLMDGRSVYTPAFSGVYWDSQDYLLEDIDRIDHITSVSYRIAGFYVFITSEPGGSVDDNSTFSAVYGGLFLSLY